MDRIEQDWIVQIGQYKQDRQDRQDRQDGIGWDGMGWDGRARQIYRWIDGQIDWIDWIDWIDGQIDWIDWIDGVDDLDEIDGISSQLVSWLYRFTIIYILDRHLFIQIDSFLNTYIDVKTH